MKNIFKRKLGPKAGPDSGVPAKLVNAKEFLGKVPGQSFGDAEFWSRYGLSLRDEESQQLEQFFELIKAGARMTGALVQKIDKGNRPYVMAGFNLPKSSINLKVIVEGSVLDFIKAYQEGKVEIDFNLDELIEEAMND